MVRVLLLVARVALGGRKREREGEQEEERLQQATKQSTSRKCAAVKRRLNKLNVENAADYRSQSHKQTCDHQSPVFEQQSSQDVGSVLSFDLVRNNHLFHDLVGDARQGLLVQVQQHRSWKHADS